MIVELGGFRTDFYGNNLQETSDLIRDYKETAWKTHKENVKNKHHEIGDPQKAGQVIYQIIFGNDYPHYLVLGTDGISFVKDKLRQRFNELKQVKSKMLV